MKEEIEEEDPEIVSARNKSNTVKVLALLNFLIGCSISQLSPFYPLRAKEAGLSVSQIGIVLGTVAATTALTGFMTSLLLKVFGRRTVMFVGQLTLIAQFATLGCLDYINDADTFFMVSVGAQIIGGIGGGANSAASMAIVTSMDSADRE